MSLSMVCIYVEKVFCKFECLICVVVIFKVLVLGLF